MCVCLSVTKNFAKEAFRQKDGLKADVYATCRITFMFMSAVLSLNRFFDNIIFSYFLFAQYAVFFRVLPCEIVAPVYYAVFFRVTLLLSAYYDSLVPNPGSRSRLQPRTTSARGKCAMNTF